MSGRSHYYRAVKSLKELLAWNYAPSERTYLTSGRAYHETTRIIITYKKNRSNCAAYLFRE